jgi:hypothetical protein
MILLYPKALAEERPWGEEVTLASFPPRLTYPVASPATAQHK